MKAYCLQTHSCRLALASAIVAMATTAASAAPGTYFVVDLGPLVQPNAINDAGVIVGRRIGPSGPWFTPVRWSHTQGLQAMPSTFGVDGNALDINSSGTAVGGQTRISILDPEANAFVWDANLTVTNIGPGAAYGINDAGQAVGIVGLPVDGPQQRGYFWDLQTNRQLDEFAKANAINNAGQIVGESSSQTRHPGTAVLLDPSEGFIFLGTLPGDDRSVALDVNDAGQTVGFSHTNSGLTTVHVSAFIWADGVMTALSVPGFDGTRANAINFTGQVVGKAFDVSGDSVAVLWENGHPTNLNDLIDPASGWLLHDAFDINARGDIVGVGTFARAWHGFLLTQYLPIPQLAARTENDEIVLSWTRGAIPVVLQSTPTLGLNPAWTDVLDTSDRLPGQAIEHRQHIQTGSAIFRLKPKLSGVGG